MSNPVWVLSVDLQTKTATFQSGMADAARSARESFKQINSGASEMGASVNRGSLDVRHALGLVDNTIRGAHSMAMVDLIRMFKDSALVMGALPFAMTAAGFALVAEVVVKGVQAYEAYKQAQEKLRDDLTKMGTAEQDVFNALNDKILEAGKETDELTGNHLGALRRELELIDHQSLDELEHAFETLAKSADETLGGLKASWYQLGIGSEGAMHALEQFQTQYAALIAKRDGAGASGLLAGTLAQAKKILQLQEQAKAADRPNGNPFAAFKDPAKYHEAADKLQQARVGWTEKEVESQQALVSTLESQLEVERQIATLKKDDSTNARIQTAQAMSKQGNGIDSKVAEGRARMMQDLTENYKEQVQTVQDGERLVIDATKQGSAERLQAIEDAMQREMADGLQDTAFYKQLSIEKLEVQREMGQQAAQQAAAIAREEADSYQKFGEMDIAAEKAKQALINSTRHTSDAALMSQAIQFANEEYALKQQALQSEITALDTSGAEYLEKLRQLQDKEKQMEQQHADEITAIKQKAAITQNQAVISAYQQMVNSTSQSLTQSLMGHQTWARMVQTFGDQVISGMMENAIKSMMLLDMDKEKQAAEAARWGFVTGMKLPFPANIVAAPVLAAGAFASVMAFEQGTDRVPGVGRGDIVPAMLAPGEGVVPGGVMDGLRNMARNGGFQSAPQNHVTMHVHMHASALDSDGMDTVLEKHSDKLERHFEKTLRRMNR